jgi:hypothetical protein
MYSIYQHIIEFFKFKGFAYKILTSIKYNLSINNLRNIVEDNINEIKLLYDLIFTNNLKKDK